jgi:hypothetical protein
VKRIRSGAGKRAQQLRIGAPDPTLTPNAGLAAITGLCDWPTVWAGVPAAGGGQAAWELVCAAGVARRAGRAASADPAGRLPLP